jgi:ABC-type transport system involved in multi-copper enzyme maturation permease subunit
MISLFNILSIAKYERKTLLRSWFFRIFSGFTLFLLFLINFIFIIQGGGDTGWAIRNIPAAIPYLNLLILNTIQAIIVVFLASDFLKRDRKLDTSEVMYMRPMTNGEYIIGKTWGNLQVFLVLNMAVILMALVFNMLSQNTTISWESYFIYPVLICMPTLVFVMGLTFLLMSIIRDQAITFVIILGYIGITLFALKSRYYYIFDYMAYNIPMLSSDIVGFGNMNVILAHRGIYFFLGLGFIFLTIFLLKRLRQSKWITYFSLVFSVIFIAAGGYLAYNHIHQFKQNERLRAEAIELNNKYVKEKTPGTISMSVSLEHKGEAIEVTSVLKVKNETNTVLRKLIFSLNDGLKISKLELNGNEVPFLREHQLVIISDNVNITPGEETNVAFTYAGNIDESLCYLDIDEKTIQEKYGKFVINVDKRYAFITPDYVLLTPEANWYPKTGVTYSTDDVNWCQPRFINFDLKVKTTPGLNAISQGTINEITAGEFSFINEHPLTQISLAIGNYKQKKVEVNNIEYGIWYIDGHDFFSKEFSDIQDTIPSLINERFQDFEHTYNLEYAFSRFFLVEVPAQFKSYERIWSNQQESVQPEQVLIPEKGYLLTETDFKVKKKQWSSDNKMTNKDIEIRMLFDFIEVFRREQTREFFIGPYPNPYFIFPMLYNFQNNIQSAKYPVSNRIFEAYLKSQATDIAGAFERDNQGMSEDELANIALQDSTFEEILTDPKQKRIIDNVIKLKSEVLFSMAQWRIAGKEEFNDFLYKFLRESRFINISFEQFDIRMNEKLGVELIPMMDNWLKAKSLPGYLFSPFEVVKVKSGERMQTKVSLKVTNFSNAEGIIKLSFRLRGGGGAGKLIYLEPKQTKEINLMLNAEPQMVMVNTMTSQNIPQVIVERFRNIEEDPRGVTFAGERVLDTPVTKQMPNEIIIDNESSLFEIDIINKTNLLGKWLKKEENRSTQRYSDISYWWPPANWTAVTNSGFFGDYIRSAHYIKSGDGSLKAKWHVPVSEPGYFDVYYHLYKPNNLMFSKGQYNFTIHNENSVQEQGLVVQSTSDGWNRLGTFYFWPDTVLVELSNKSEVRIIFADAIKFVKL